MTFDVVVWDQRHAADPRESWEERLDRSELTDTPAPPTALMAAFCDWFDTREDLQDHVEGHPGDVLDGDVVHLSFSSAVAGSSTDAIAAYCATAGLRCVFPAGEG
jgi:hypothetical protein